MSKFKIKYLFEGSQKRALVTAVEHSHFRKNSVQINTEKLVKSYSEVPGPKELPLIGNAWRFLPIIGEMLKFNNFLGVPGHP